MKKKIKIDLVKLDKKQTDLLKILKERGYKIGKGELCEYVNETKQSPKQRRVIKECNQIISEWKEIKKNSKKKK